MLAWLLRRLCFDRTYRLLANTESITFRWKYLGLRVENKNTKQNKLAFNMAGYTIAEHCNRHGAFVLAERCDLSVSASKSVVIIILSLSNSRGRYANEINQGATPYVPFRNSVRLIAIIFCRISDTNLWRQRRWLELEPSPRPSPPQLVVFGLFFFRESMAHSVLTSVSFTIR